MLAVGVWGAQIGGRSLWMLPVDGINGPQVLVKDAYSGAVQR